MRLCCGVDGIRDAFRSKLNMPVIELALVSKIQDFEDAVLEDTLVAFQLNAFKKTCRRKAISRSKLYFFDICVTNSLANRGEIIEGSEMFGNY